MRLPVFLFAALVLNASDRDHDGIDDKLEQQLLERFRPEFLISANDCDGMPAEFAEGPAPTVKALNGVIYGQAFHPRAQAVELHWFHLWANDCGRAGHALDVEHVSALVAKNREGDWQALYWYAAAHQDTLCDAAQGARGADLAAVTRGARIWISHGKHASFLSLDACHRGCGGDRCTWMRALPRTRIVNVGEFGHPLNGAGWIRSRRWDFAAKLQSDFPAATVARLEHATGVIAIEPARIPVHATIGGLNEALNQTGNALTTAGTHTENSLALSAEKVANSLGKAKRKTIEWIRQRTR